MGEYARLNKMLDEHEQALRNAKLNKADDETIIDLEIAIGEIKGALLEMAEVDGLDDVYEAFDYQKGETEMIRILDENFAKKVKRELRKPSNGFNKVVVRYYIKNETKNGKLTIEIHNSFALINSFETMIEFDWRIISMGLNDGKEVERIVFAINPTDCILDIILHDHYVECWQNAYGWDFQICPKEDTVPNTTPYHISMITFYNAKRSKLLRFKENCFEGFEVIAVNDGSTDNCGEILTEY